MAIDLRKAYYNDGTCTVSNGGTTVTGQGTAWAQAIRRGDMFGTHVGMPTRIASVDSNTQITLAYPWAGPDQTEAAYEIQFTSDDVTYQASVRDLLTALANGNIAALAALALAEGRYLRGTGPGAMETVDGANLDALVGLTGAADKLSFFTGEGAMDLTALTEFARTLLAGADAAAMRETLNAQQELGFTPVNKVGDTMTGALTAPGFISTYPIQLRPIPWADQSSTLSTGEVDTVLGSGNAWVWSNFSGLMIINNKNTGGVQVAIGGGGSVTVVATVGDVGSGSSWTYAPAQNGYGFVNGPNSAPFGAMGLRTRMGA